MSDFGEALFDLLPMHSALQNPKNPARKLIDTSIGEWFDSNDVNVFYDNLFIQTATGAYLDLFGKDYNVTRQLNESDDSYRERIIQEKNDRLTPAYLKSLYGLALYVYIDGFNVVNNTLTSDNPFISNEFMSAADDTVINILNQKFLLDSGIHWLVDGSLDYLINTSNVNVISEYMDVYKLNNLDYYFSGNTSLVKVNLNLPQTNIKSTTQYGSDGAKYLFNGCTNLTDVILNIPHFKALPNHWFDGCTSLTNLTLDLKYCHKYSPNICPALSSLKSVNIKIDSSFESSYINKFSNTTNYPNLETLIVNGVEVDLS